MNGHRRSVKGDPFWMTARFDSNCPRCGKAIYRGNRIFYYPHGKRALCEGCGKNAERDFMDMSEMDRF